MDGTYQQLADRSRKIIKNDPNFQPYYYERGVTFCTDGKAGHTEKNWQQICDRIKTSQSASLWNQLDTPGDLFRHLHGSNAEPVSFDELGRDRRWIKGYTSKCYATVDAENMVRVYFERARARSNIKSLLGTPVDHLLYGSNKDIEGVVLENGHTVHTTQTIIATGA